MTEDSHCRTRLEFSEEAHMQRERGQSGVRLQFTPLAIEKYNSKHIQYLFSLSNKRLPT